MTMTYGNVKCKVKACETHEHPCFVLHCETCGDIGGHYSDFSMGDLLAKAHERTPHEIKTDNLRA